MAKYKIEYLPIAYDDLEDIFTYVAADNSSAAVKLLADIDKAILNLEDFPDMGVKPKNRHLVMKSYQLLIVDDYLVFYVVVDDVIEIRRIISGKRNYAGLVK